MQRCFEVAKLRHRLAETVSTKATAHMFHKEYQKQLVMCPGSAGAEAQVRDLKFRDRPGVVLTQGGLTPTAARTLDKTGANVEH